MAKLYKPFVDITTNKYPYKKSITFPTYAELKKNIKTLILESIDGKLFVYRTRRGEWGQWFKYWGMLYGKPTITKEGWL